MKKIYKSIALFAILISSSLFAQTDKERSTLNFTEAQKLEILSQVKTAPISVENPYKLGSPCDSLTVATAAGNSYSGNMFDVTVASTITLETFSVSVDAGTWVIEIYYRTGTFVGSESSATGWNLLGSGSVTSSTTGAGSFYKVPVNIGLALTSGTYGFYVTAVDAGCTFNYTDGTAVGNVFSSNGFLSVKEGNGGGYPFAVTFSPRVFNGKVHYCVGVTTGIEQELTMSSSDIYPNPASESVSLDLSAFNGSEVKLSIVNMLGQTIQTSSIIANGIQTMNVADFAAGIYFMKVETNGKIDTIKLIVE